VLLDGEVIEEPHQVLMVELPGVGCPVEPDVPDGPRHVGLLGPGRIVTSAQRGPELIEQPGPLRTAWRWVL